MSKWATGWGLSTCQFVFCKTWIFLNWPPINFLNFFPTQRWFIQNLVGAHPPPTMPEIKGFFSGIKGHWWYLMIHKPLNNKGLFCHLTTISGKKIRGLPFGKLTYCSWLEYPHVQNRKNNLLNPGPFSSSRYVSWSQGVNGVLLGCPIGS